MTPRGIEACADILGISAAEVVGVATFYTMYKRRPVGDYHVGVCTNTLCAVMGGDAIFEPAQGPPRRSATTRPPTDGKITLEHVECNAACDYAPGDDGQLGVHRQPDPGVGDPSWSTTCAPARRSPPPAAPRICTWREAERVLAGFPDDRADEGPAAGPAVAARPADRPRARLDAPRPAEAHRRARPRRRRAGASRPTPTGPSPRPDRASPTPTTAARTPAARQEAPDGRHADPGALRRLGHRPSWTLEAYERRGGYAALRTACGMAPDDVIAAGQGLRPARPRRRGLPDRHEVGLHPAGRRQAALPGGQRRRVRAGHLQGHPADDGHRRTRWSRA